jgi:hypothetical protein
MQTPPPQDAPRTPPTHIHAQLSTEVVYESESYSTLRSDSDNDKQTGTHVFVKLKHFHSFVRRLWGDFLTSSPVVIGEQSPHGAPTWWYAGRGLCKEERNPHKLNEIKYFRCWTSQLPYVYKMCVCVCVCIYVYIYIYMLIYGQELNICRWGETPWKNLIYDVWRSKYAR